MTEEQIGELCAELHALAFLVGLRFVPDPEKIAGLIEREAEKKLSMTPVENA
jgi:hypothetical protein